MNNYLLKLNKVGMGMVRNFQMKVINCLLLIPLYYIMGAKNIFLYVLSFALYKVFLACFKNVTITDVLNKYQDSYGKYKIFKLTILIIGVISLIFLLLSIMISDVIGNLLKINNSFITFFMMGLSICWEPITKISLEYIDNLNYKKLYKGIYNLYNYLEMGLLLIIALVVFINNKMSIDVANGMLYLAKIISALIVNGIIYIIVFRKRKNVKSRESQKIDYKYEIKRIFNRDNVLRIVGIGEGMYYYFSIIILYLMLSKRYSYMIENVVVIISFLYFYVFKIVNFIGEMLIRKYSKQEKILNKIYGIFDNYLKLAIVLGIMAPLICFVIFNNSTLGIYLIMGSFLGIFMTLFKVTFKELGNHKLGYLSLGLGIMAKIILMIPLVDSFYRMGYNLVYGDIISTIIGMSISIVVNYIYFKNKERDERFFEKLLRSMYESIFLCIILVVMQFIIPIRTDNYIYSLLLMVIYGYASSLFIKFKKKKRV